MDALTVLDYIRATSSRNSYNFQQAFSTSFVFPSTVNRMIFTSSSISPCEFMHSLKKNPPSLGVPRRIILLQQENMYFLCRFTRAEDDWGCFSSWTYCRRPELDPAAPSYYYCIMCIDQWESGITLTFLLICVAMDMLS